MPQDKNILEEAEAAEVGDVEVVEAGAVGDTVVVDDGPIDSGDGYHGTGATPIITTGDTPTTGPLGHTVTMELVDLTIITKLKN